MTGVEAKTNKGGIKMVYECEWSGHSYPVPAQKVKEIMDNLYDRDGEYSHEAFVEYSRPDDSETHILFEWDDSIAAEKYRLVQASKIRSNLHVRIVTREANPEEKRVISAPAYVNKEVDNNNTKARFVPIEKALNKDSEYRDIVISNAKRELFEIANKVRVFEEFKDVVKVIDELKGNHA